MFQHYAANKVKVAVIKNCKWSGPLIFRLILIEIHTTVLYEYILDRFMLQWSVINVKVSFI